MTHERRLPSSASVASAAAAIAERSMRARDDGLFSLAGCVSAIRRAGEGSGLASSDKLLQEAALAEFALTVAERCQGGGGGEGGGAAPSKLSPSSLSHASLSFSFPSPPVPPFLTATRDVETPTLKMK